MTSLSPAEYAAKHRAFVETVMAPVAEKAGAKKLSEDFIWGLDAETRANPDVKLAASFLSDLVFAKGLTRLPLGAAYALLESTALAAAEYAAATAMGKITDASARFLPADLRAAYPREIGGTIDMAPGVAARGVTITGDATAETVTIDFEKALAGVTAQNVILAIGENVIVSADSCRGNGRDERDWTLPPYRIVIQASPKSPYSYVSNKGTSSFTSGSVVSPGTTTYKLGTESNNCGLATLTVTLDKTNNYGPYKRGTAATEALRNSWHSYFTNGAHDFASAIANGTLLAKTDAEAKKFKGMQTARDWIRNTVQNTTTQTINVVNLVKSGEVSYAFDPMSESMVVRYKANPDHPRYAGKADPRELLFIVQKGKLQGYFETTPGEQSIWRELLGT